jgi:hypothetical protein
VKREAQKIDRPLLASAPGEGRGGAVVCFEICARRSRRIAGPSLALPTRGRVERGADQTYSNTACAGRAVDSEIARAYNRTCSS